MKKALIGLAVLMVLAFQSVNAGDEASKSPELAALEEQVKTANSELSKMKAELVKSMKDDEGLKAVNEKKKAAEKEYQDYLLSKKPEIADLQKKIDDLKKQVSDAKKAKKPAALKKAE